MDNEENLTTGEMIIKRFSTIKELCDSASALFAKNDTAQDETDTGTVAFEFTEKIQEEIEEIRDLLFEGS
jgi:hypothetical protein